MKPADNPYLQKYRERRKPPRRKVSFHWRQRWRGWINRRLPPVRSIVFDHKNLFIFPGKAGYGFLLLIVLLLLVAINFENSAVYAMVFLLSGVFAVSILHTFFNVAGLKIVGLDGEPTFAGREAVFHFRLTASDRPHYGVQLSWQNLSSERIDVGVAEEKRLSLRFRTGPRGYCKPGRVKVESCYPLGLIRCWTWVDFDQQTLVYPNPDRDAGLPEFSNRQNDENSEDHFDQKCFAGSEDFFGLRDYIGGDSIRNIAWKTYAKNGQLSSKQFIDYQDQRMWLDWENTSGDTERRLQQLCHWALQAEAGHSEYGLIIPGQQLTPGRGNSHLNELLACLATFNLPNPASVEVAYDKPSRERAATSGSHHPAATGGLS